MRVQSEDFRERRRGRGPGLAKDLSSDSGLDGWGRFEEFVGAKRKDGQMKNDDVGLIIVEGRRNGCES